MVIISAFLQSSVEKWQFDFSASHSAVTPVECVGGHELPVECVGRHELPVKCVGRHELPV